MIGILNTTLPDRNVDTINLADVDIGEHNDDQLEDWVPERASVQHQQKFMKCTYNSRNQDSRVVLQSTALIVGLCKAASFWYFLIHNDRIEEDKDTVIFTGMMIEDKDLVFQVQLIPKGFNEV